MKHTIHALAVLALTTAPALAQPAPAAAEAQSAPLGPEMAKANAKPGPRTVPGREIPVPATVSDAFRPQVAAPYRSPAWNADPKDAAAWKELVDRLAKVTASPIPALREKLGVTSETAILGGVKVFIVQPKSMPEAHRDHLLLHIHGGGYVYNPGEAGTLEAVLMAGLGGYKVISVDYRMPPDAPYPAAMDDATAVWKAMLGMQKPGNMAVFGTSTGGGMTLALMLRAKAEGLPLPAAMGLGTPWSDMTETGDSYRTNEWLDNVLVSYSGYLTPAAKLYANGRDLKDPQLSPIYGDFGGLPPALLVSGTRDLFLSNTVRTHRKLREAGIPADLHVFEGMSHAQYLAAPDSPETKQVFGEMTRFFNARLGH
ncbi:alpha/beta hydrolase [Methylobacterium sp. J-076]|uniref:alpha/beta hydrolase n=1 Tax=Methylobacterium sp. J-076 TaxID=2836655 RepID=UPI001FBA0404|nr:alpha/beta hydrolase [Methylobacterium sp. J-076]MCJ2015773.1 alpha/beta hydrolase [Methylobacterium sp. J-076]